MRLDSARLVAQGTEPKKRKYKKYKKLRSRSDDDRLVRFIAQYYIGGVPIPRCQVGPLLYLSPFHNAICRR